MGLNHCFASGIDKPQVSPYSDIMNKLKDRKQTEKRLIRAVGTVLVESGFGAVGVNSVAKAAGVDKVLIYRYFNGLNGLVEAYARAGSFWPDTKELITPSFERELEKHPAKALAKLLSGYAKALEKRPEALEVMAWELSAHTGLATILEKFRENQALSLTQKLSEVKQLEGIDVEALCALLSAAINYLLLRKRTVRMFCGLDITKSKDWKRFETGIETMLGALLAQNMGQNTQTVK